MRDEGLTPGGERDLIEHLIYSLRKEIVSWRKIGTMAIADRIEQVVRETHAEWKKRKI